MRQLLAWSLLLSVFPALAAGSVLPASGTLSLGFTQELESRVNATPIPSVSATWPLASHLAIRSSIAYFQEHDFDLGFSRLRSEYLPAAVGFRFYAGSPAENTRGMFLDASPVIAVARFADDAGGHFLRAPLGVEVGMGFRVPGFDGSRLELGLNYTHLSATGPDAPLTRPAELRSGGGSGISTAPVHFFSLRAGVGWGD